jgi:hypothetical protein
VISAPKHPKELAKTISGFRALISHRLHANIIAHSYAIPTVGLKWDAKILSYFILIDREQFCLEMRSPEEIVDALLRSISVGVPIDVIDDLKESTAHFVQSVIGKKI